MEETKSQPLKYFQDLTSEEKKILFKEFNKSVKTYYKIFRWFGIGLILPMLIGGGFSIYYMINILLAG